VSHETKIVHGKPLGDSKRWIAQCSCGRRSDSWLDCDDARANLANMHPPGVLLSDPRDAEIAALRARVAALEAVERAAREYRRLMRFCMESPDSTRQDEEDRDVAEDALDAALAAVEVPRG